MTAYTAAQLAAMDPDEAWQIVRRMTPEQRGALWEEMTDRPEFSDFKTDLGVREFVDNLNENVAAEKR